VRSKRGKLLSPGEDDGDEEAVLLGARLMFRGFVLRCTFTDDRRRGNGASSTSFVRDDMDDCLSKKGRSLSKARGRPRDGGFL
jgi:hypothetical protein